DSATDASLFVENFLGRFSTQNLDIQSRNSAGILVESLAGTMEIGGNTSITNGTSLITDHAIDVNNSTGDISFSGTLGITGSTGQGISFDTGVNTGTFRVFGDTSISGTALEAFIVRDDSPVITMGNAILSNTSTANSVLLLDNAGQGGTAGQVTFGDVNVTGTTGATLPTVHILNNTPTIRFNGLDVITTSAAFPTLAPSVFVQTNPGIVDFGKLDIDSTDNLAFIANANTGTIRSSEGTIVVADAAAIDIQDSNIAMRLTSVTAGPTSGASLNVTNGFFLNSAGIRLSNTPGTFTITGDGTIDSGGTITSAQHGVWVEQIESVNIDGLEIQSPITSGIEWHETDVDTVHSMNLTRVRIENSAGDGIVVENGRVFNLVDSILENNGTAATEHSLEYTVNVELTDTTDDFFAVTLQGNTITDDSADAILIQSGGLLDDSLMNFTLEDQNTITNTASNTDNLAVVWEGPINVLVRNFNNFIGTAPTDNIGININATSNDLDDTLNFSVFNQNNFNISGPDSVGILVNTDGPSNIFIANNNNDATPAITGQTNIGFVMGGFDSTAIQFQSLAANSTVQVDNNSFDMTNTLSRGIFFDLINATNSGVQIDNNEFQIFDINGFTELVIGFNTVLNGPLQIGTGADNPVFFTPAGGTNGSFLLFNPGGGTFNGQIRVDGTLFP
ncbi:hypothetical protein, partial [uncultured Gimesia sp.]|uniref:beta strand repeat-containing protein n=1 Tax=uncultured Gimesia sp. TaxID=1678688 RepID=UPI00263A1933